MVITGLLVADGDVEFVGDYSIADLTELFPIGRATVYRTLQRGQSSARTCCVCRS